MSNFIPTEVISLDPAVEAAKIIRPLTEINERECLARLAREVIPGGLIVEIGGCIGGTTAVLALAAPNVEIQVLDDFSWTPGGETMSTSKARLLANMRQVGAYNVSVIKGDSREIGKVWVRPVDLVFIDGGHSLGWCDVDLRNFAKHARVIAMHDYGNPVWTSIKQAVDEFLSDFPQWYIAEVIGWVVVLRQR